MIEKIKLSVTKKDKSYEKEFGIIEAEKLLNKKSQRKKKEGWKLPKTRELNADGKIEKKGVKKDKPKLETENGDAKK